MKDEVAGFLEDHGCKRIAYLGDGVYIGHDGGQAWLVTQRWTHRSPKGGPSLHYIAINAEVQHSLLCYLQPNTPIEGIT